VLDREERGAVHRAHGRRARVHLPQRAADPDAARLLHTAEDDPLGDVRVARATAAAEDDGSPDAADVRRHLLQYAGRIEPVLRGEHFARNYTAKVYDKVISY